MSESYRLRICFRYIHVPFRSWELAHITKQSIGVGKGEEIYISACAGESTRVLCKSVDVLRAIGIQYGAAGGGLKCVIIDYGRSQPNERFPLPKRADLHT